MRTRRRVYGRQVYKGGKGIRTRKRALRVGVRLGIAGKRALWVEVRLWEGLREGGSFAGESEAWEGSREERESSASESEAWEGLQEEREGFISGNKAWEGVTGESTGNKGLTGASEAWEGLQESRESRESLQEPRKSLQE
jgi:hypothetical protein